MDPLMNIRYMYKLALGSRNNENSVLTFFQTSRLRLESSLVRIYLYKKCKGGILKIARVTDKHCSKKVIQKNCRCENIKLD